MIYKFRIELIESNPLVWREVVVPGDYSLYTLHLVIQAAFGWNNAHLFQFSKTGLGDKVNYSVPFYQEDLDEMVDARATDAKKVFKKKGDDQTYIYDFGHRLFS